MTTAIDHLTDEPAYRVLPIAYKLDVEGAEVDLVEGARRVLRGDAAFFTKLSGNLFHITSLDAARLMKSAKYRGYNFLALGHAQGRRRQVRQG